MLDYEHQRRFRRNVKIIGALHAVLILVTFIFSSWKRVQERSNSDVMWLDGGGLATLTAGQQAAAHAHPEAETLPASFTRETPVVPPPPAALEPAPEPEPEPIAPAEPEPAPEPEPLKPATASELAAPTATPTPTPAPTPKPTPTPKATPTPRPKGKSTPEPTPKPVRREKAEPKPKEKAKASPTPRARTSPKPTTVAAAKEKPKSTPKPVAQAAASPKAKPSPAAEDAATAAAKLAFNKATGRRHEGAGNSEDKGTAAGTGGGNRGGAGRAGGGNRQSDHGWYHLLIHDRFYSRWDQPTSIISSDQKFIATLQIRIDKDGHISNVSLAHPSGNVVMDESVLAAARKVTQIDPLPAGLGDGSHYDVRINFELSQQSVQ